MPQNQTGDPSLDEKKKIYSLVFPVKRMMRGKITY